MIIKLTYDEALSLGWRQDARGAPKQISGPDLIHSRHLFGSSDELFHFQLYNSQDEEDQLTEFVGRIEEILEIGQMMHKASSSNRKRVGLSLIKKASALANA